MTNITDERKTIIQKYVDAYNSFDVTGMIELFRKRY
jgi:hypothetical protein